MEQKYIRICRNTLYATLKILHSLHIVPLIWAVNTAYKYPWSISLNSCTCPSTSFSDTPFLLRSIWLLLCSPNWKNNALQHSPGCTPKSTVQPSSLSFLNSLLWEIQQAIVLQTQKNILCKYNENEFSEILCFAAPTFTDLSEIIERSWHLKKIVSEVRF